MSGLAARLRAEAEDAATRSRDFGRGLAHAATIAEAHERLGEAGRRAREIVLDTRCSVCRCCVLDNTPEGWICEGCATDHGTHKAAQEPAWDARISLAYDEKDGRWRVLTEARDGRAHAAEAYVLEAALRLAEDAVREFQRKPAEPARPAPGVYAPKGQPRINSATPHRASYIASLRASTRPRYRAIKESYRAEQHNAAVWFWQGMFRPNAKEH